MQGAVEGRVYISQTGNLVGDLTVWGSIWRIEGPRSHQHQQLSL